MANEERLDAIQPVGSNGFPAAARTESEKGAGSLPPELGSIRSLPRADGVVISEEAREEEAAEALGAAQAAAVQNAGGAGSVSSNWDATLVQDCLAVQQQKQAGASGAQNPWMTGVEPGMQPAAVLSSVSGVQAGLPAGMQAGGTYTSPGGPIQGYQPGGGLADPAVIKLEQDYARAIQDKIPLKPETQQMVQTCLSEKGVERNPFQAQLVPSIKEQTSL